MDLVTEQKTNELLEAVGTKRELEETLRTRQKQWLGDML